MEERSGRGTGPSQIEGGSKDIGSERKYEQ